MSSQRNTILQSISTMEKLPPPLLAIIAFHLSLASLLRLQRCSSTLHRLRGDKSYMQIAWRWVQLRLSPLEMEMPPSYGCRLILHACTHLQHLHLCVDGVMQSVLTHDIFALLPHLRSLHLESRQLVYGALDEQVDMRHLLDSLPHLTSLHCTALRNMGIASLLAIASHSTLDDIAIDSQQLGESHWTGGSITFPFVGEAKKQQREAQQSADQWLGEEIKEQQHRSNQRQEQQTAIEKTETQRILTALTRTQSTQRSCKVRMELADWLHGQVCRERLFTDDDVERNEAVELMMGYNRFGIECLHPKWRLQCYRRQVTIVRSTLQRQLSDAVL